MPSPFGKDKAAKDAECYAQEKNSRTSLNRQDLTNLFIEVTQLDEINFQRMSSPTNSIYSEARNSVAERNRCFGDSCVPPSETSPTLEKDITDLSENILKQILIKQNFTTSKSIHIDIPPENIGWTDNGESSCADVSEIRENCTPKDKVSNSEGVLEDESSKEIRGARSKFVDTSKKIRCENTYDGNSTKEFQGARSNVAVTSMKIRYENTCDDERRVRWSSEEPKLSYFCGNLAETSSTESVNETILKEKFSNCSRRQNFPPEITPLLTNANTPQMCTETAECSVQTDIPYNKCKKKSKFKTALLEFFLSCVKCFM